MWPLVTNRFDPDFTSKVLKNKSGWSVYAKEFALYALLYGFDGYNFDFENIHYADRAALTAFVKYLSEELHRYGLYTSIDVTGYSDSGNWSKVYDRKELGKAVDYVVLMAYDETWASSTSAGPVASYPWVEKHADLLANEVKADKIVLGIPYYTRIWSVSTNADGSAVKGGAKGRTLSIRDARAYLADYADKVVWNDDLRLYYLEFADGLRMSKRIWFEEERSLSYKLYLAKERGFAGFAAWRKGFEDDAAREVIPRVYH